MYLGFRLLMISIVFAIPAMLFSCTKLIDVDPPATSLTSENVYTNDATASAVLTGVYSSFGNSSPLRAATINSIFLACGLSGDELTLHGGSANANAALVQFYQNSLTSGLSTMAAQTIWRDIYAKLYIVNLALERLALSEQLTPAVKLQLTGEAKFLRAFLYFYLVNLYGDVPLATTSDYRTNAILSRASKAQVYEQIIADLKDAQNELSDGYVAADSKSPTAERLTPNKWASTALLARTYLYTGNWESAEEQATAIINNKANYQLDSLNKTFLKNSPEAIWQLQPVNRGWNTEDARIFILPKSGPTSNSSVEGYPVHLSPQLLNSFEPGDLRKERWISSVTITRPGGNAIYYFPYKYKSATLNAPSTEYMTVFRLAEQYLIRAEARIQQNNVTGAQSDLNELRKRAGLSNTSAANTSSLLTAIMHERQVELFTEWGHRWLDLKRTENIDVVMTTVTHSKGTTWNNNWQFYPIPLYDIIQNPNLVQNAGY